MHLEELILELETTRCWSGGEEPSEQPAQVDLASVAGDVHFIGIGGIGMSALARLLLAEGKGVSGSDKEASPITDELQRLGARIFIGHEAGNIEGAGLVVVSTAIGAANPELKSARALAVPVVHRSQVLSLLSAGKKLVAVSGTHGKTTTTGMVAQILLDAGYDPSVVVGGVFARIASNSRCGKGAVFVAEADESDRTHAGMNSYISVVTNIEADHLENYPGGMEQICQSMLSFANHSQAATVICLDDPGCRSIEPCLKTKVITYGSVDVSACADYTLENLQDGSFNVYYQGHPLGSITLSVPGWHNRLNALAACAVARQLGVPFETIASSLSGFAGVARRFQILGRKGNITVVDDYGHHPTEVRATLEAARQYQLQLAATGQGAESGRIVAVFQPHQPGRLKDLWGDFCQSFQGADLVLVTDIYVARGGQIEGITSEKFAREIPQENVHYVSGPTGELPSKILPFLRPGDLVLTIGAGDITKLGGELLKGLN